MALRWGIVSAGKISHDFATALRLLPTSDHTIVAVAAADKGRAQRFAELHKIPKFYDKYESLAKDPEIDVVYIGTINPHHYLLGILMLENGKHVLCEKPLCMNEKQSASLISIAKSKKLFLMEAIWSRFFPAYQYVRKSIDSGVLGDITEVTVSFGFELEDVDRLRLKSLGGGTILDLGVYTIQLSQWIFKEPPVLIQANGKLNVEEVDMEMEAVLTYSNNRKSFIRTSGEQCLDNTAVIKGTKGEITIIDFWCPTKIKDFDGKIKEFTLPSKGTDAYNFVNSGGLHYEAEAVRLCIKNKQIESDIVSHEESLIIAKIEDEIRSQLGVIYPEDELQY